MLLLGEQEEKAREERKEVNVVTSHLKESTGGWDPQWHTLHFHKENTAVLQSLNTVGLQGLQGAGNGSAESEARSSLFLVSLLFSH